MDSMNSSAITDDHQNMCNPSPQPNTIESKKSQWLSMKARITDLVGKVNVSNVEFIADQILRENIIEGRGVFCQTVMNSQLESPQSSHVYATLIAIINSEFPQVGNLLSMRALLQFNEARESGDKKRIQTAARFLAQLVNKRVIYAYLTESVLMLLMADNPTSDTLEVAASFCIQCGSLMMDLIPHKQKQILAEFRRLLREGELEKRVQVMIVRLFAAKKRKFKLARRGNKDLDAIVDNLDQIHHSVCFWLTALEPEFHVDEFHHSEVDDGDVDDDDEVSSF